LIIGKEKNSHLQKKRLSDMLGPQWSKEELERFYSAYRKYGKDWRKVCFELIWTRDKGIAPM
jgi:hypothetical protein